jgi:hypothetical protein
MLFSRTLTDNVDDLRGKHDSILGAIHLAAHVDLDLVTSVAAEGLEAGWSAP